MKKIAVDLGNINMKIAYTEDNETIQTALVKSLVATNSLDTNHVVEMENNKVHFGVGYPLTENNKVHRKYLKESFLLACHLGKCLANDTVEIGVALPVDVYKSPEKLRYQDILNQIKELKGTVNGKAYHLVINKITVYSEGYSAFLSISHTLPKGPLLFIDMGFRTTDVISLDFINHKWVIQDYLTVHTGLYHFYDTIRCELITDNLIVNTITVDNYFTYRPIFTTDTGQINLYDKLPSCKTLAIEILKDIKSKWPDSYSRTKVFSGGGGIFLNELVQAQQKILLDKEPALYGNVIGIYQQMNR